GERLVAAPPWARDGLGREPVGDGDEGVVVRLPVGDAALEELRPCQPGIRHRQPGAAPSKLMSAEPRARNSMSCSRFSAKRSASHSEMTWRSRCNALVW